MNSIPLSKRYCELLQIIVHPKSMYKFVLSTFIIFSCLPSWSYDLQNNCLEVLNPKALMEEPEWFNGNFNELSKHDKSYRHLLQIFKRESGIITVLRNLSSFEDTDSIFITPLNTLDVSEGLKHRIHSIPNIETVEDLGRYQANELQQFFGFGEDDFLELLPALTQLGLDLVVPYKWDQENYRLKELFPEY